MALPPEGDQHSPPLCPDESDYQTEYEEEVPDSPTDTYADFQSAPADVASDSVSCPDPPFAPWPGWLSEPHMSQWLCIRSLENPGPGSALQLAHA